MATAAAGLALAGAASAYTPAAHFYSPSGNIECIFNNNEVLKEPQPNTLDCGTFNNHRHVVIIAGQHGGPAYWPQVWTAYFHPGHSPVLAYGSTWTRGGFTCKSTTAGMTCWANSNKLGFTISRSTVTRYPPVPVSSSSRDYITADAMEATFEENGITVNGRHLSWLEVSCIGQGEPNGTALDRNGIPEKRYHLFECDGTLSNNRTAIVHTSIFKWPGRPDRFKYTYQVISII
jgi:hypothetical protein